MCIRDSIVPVYGRSELLEQALSSVLEQENRNWKLIIADDGSDADTQEFLRKWTERNDREKIEWHRRSANLGLFTNLNKAIEDTCTEWILLLCSDDLLLPTALNTLSELSECWPKTRLILSSFISINADGSTRPADSAWHHKQVSEKTDLIPTERFIPALLQLGSLNGNLTGMAFTRRLWQEAGPFKADWRHAADWEWLIRTSECGPILLNRAPIAKVRTHSAQLSNSNRRGGEELREVAEVVRQLCSHRLLINEAKRKLWAAHIMQFQLWNLIKIIWRQPTQKSINQLKQIKKAGGLTNTAIALLRSIPNRVVERFKAGG